MATLNKDLIRKNLLKLLEFSGLSDIDYANLLNVSSKQIKRIRKDEAEFSIDNINKSCAFFDKSFNEINTKEMRPDSHFRQNLLIVHNNQPEYGTLLQKRPSITYAIKFELMDNIKFIEGKLSVKEIDQIFRNKGWIYTSSYISLALKRNIDKIKIARHPVKKNSFVYTKL